MCLHGSVRIMWSAETVLMRGHAADRPLDAGVLISTLRWSLLFEAPPFALHSIDDSALSLHTMLG